MGEDKVEERNKGALAELKIKNRYATEQIREEEEYYSESDEDQMEIKENDDSIDHTNKNIP